MLEAVSCSMRSRRSEEYASTDFVWRRVGAQRTLRLVKIR